MIWARSSWFSIIRLYQVRKMLERSLAVFAAQRLHGLFRRIDGLLRFLRAQLRHAGDHVADRGVGHVDLVVCIDPLAVDVALFLEQRLVLQQVAKSLCLDGVHGAGLLTYWLMAGGVARATRGSKADQVACDVMCVHISSSVITGLDPVIPFHFLQRCPDQVRA
jgi:hypothetical protein